MDSFFGIGAPELIVILLLAGIVLGPQRVRQIALWMGKTTAYFQSISREFARQLSAELDAVDQGGEMKEALQEVQDLRREVTELRQELTDDTVKAVQSGKDAIAESEDMVRNSIAPPSLLADTADTDEDADDSSDELPNPLQVEDDPENETGNR